VFDIEYKGGNAVVLATKKVSLAIDPNRSEFGLKDVTIKGGAELATERRFLTNSSDYAVSLEGPGEYEISDLLIKGFPAYRHLDDRGASGMDTTIYRIEVGNIQVGVLGNIDGKLDDDQLEELGVIDILILPVGGNGYTMDAVSASELTNKIGPKVVIPVHFADAKLKYAVTQDNIDQYIETMKLPVKEEKKLKIKSPASLPESMEIYKLSID
jgi:hypothetical protein